MKTAANGQRIYTNNLHRCAAINSHRIRSTQDKGQCQGEQLNFPPTNFKFLRHVFAPSRHRIEYAWNNWIEKMKGKIWKMAFTRSEIKSPLNLNIKKLNCNFPRPPPPPPCYKLLFKFLNGFSSETFWKLRQYNIYQVFRVSNFPLTQEVFFYQALGLCRPLSK